jgi:hypothetical protein
MLNFKSFFKPSLVDIAKDEMYAAERALLSAKVNKSFCESDIAYNTARIEHLRAAIGAAEPVVKPETTSYGQATPPVGTGYVSSMPV